MRFHPIPPFAVLLIAIFLAMVGTRFAGADYVSLHDGRLLEGEVVEEKPTFIMFRHNVAGIWTTAKINRADIDALDRRDGDQSDGAMREFKGDAAKPNARNSNPAAPAQDDRPRVMVVPLHGTVGGGSGKSLRDTFDAGMIEECFAAAQKAGAKMVILDINSPGGLVSEMELICQTIINWHGRLRIVAYPREAFSAAAIISLCCREMGVRSDSRIGAAVIVQSGEGGLSAVDAKMASPHHAMQRQFMAASGQPYEVVSAMTIQETQLWWSPEKGFTTIAPRSDAHERWTQVDSATTVLTMTSDEAVQWGLAEGPCENELALLRRLDVKDDVQIVRMDAEVDRYLDSLDRRYQDLVKQSTNYFRALGSLADSLNALNKAYSSRDRDAASALKADIRQQVKRLQNAGRAIAKIDKSLLARRVDVPEDVIEQMKIDSAVLGRIGSLLSTDTVDGFNESADRLNAVIASWRKLLGLEK